MKLPFVTRKEYEELEARLLDIERHFVTKRDATGKPTETLADVPFAARKERKPASLRGASWPQMQRYLERTDGGRIVNSGG